MLLLPWAARADDGLLPDKLRALEAELRAASDVRTLLIERGGRTGFSYYRADTGADTLLGVASVTKSVTSLLAGIAQDQGLLRVEEPLAAFFPEQTNQALARITLRDTLMMATGFERTSLDDYQDFIGRFYAPNWIAHAMARRVVAAPGQRFVYSNWDAHLVAAALARRVKQPLQDFAREKLFTPLGIADFDWPRGTDGIPNGAADLKLTAPDMLRIGRMALQGGRWGERQVVPRAFMQQATARQIASDQPPRGRAELWGYGYLWWTSSTPGDDLPAFYAAGYGGQFIYVVPALDLVIAAQTNQVSRAVAARTAGIVRDFALAAVVR